MICVIQLKYKFVPIRGICGLDLLYILQTKVKNFKDSIFVLKKICVDLCNLPAGRHGLWLN